MKVFVSERLNGAVSSAKDGAAFVAEVIILLHTADRSAAVETQQDRVKRIPQRPIENASNR